MSREIELEKKVNRVLEEAIDAGELPCGCSLAGLQGGVVGILDFGRSAGCGNQYSHGTGKKGDKVFHRALIKVIQR